MKINGKILKLISVNKEKLGITSVTIKIEQYLTNVMQ